MKYYLHKTKMGLLLNESPRTTNYGTIFSSVGGVQDYIKALSNTLDTTIILIIK